MPIPPDRIIALGETRTDSEREAIAFLRDRLTAGYSLAHSAWIHRDGQEWEVDLILLAPQCVWLLDVKNLHGRIEASRAQWSLDGRGRTPSPLQKLEMHARELKTMLKEADPALSSVFIRPGVLLTAPDVLFVDHTGWERKHVRKLADSIEFLEGSGDLPPSAARRIGPLHERILNAVAGASIPRPRVRSFGEWEEVERLGGDEDVQEYRARHPRSGEVVRVREYRADPYAPKAEQQAQLRRIETAFVAMHRLRRHPNVLGVLNFFRNEDGNGWVLVSDEPVGDVLARRLRDRAQPLSFAEQTRIIRDVLSALEHAHAHGVVHRQLSPDAVLIGEQTLLVGFDYARAPRPGGGSIASQIEDRLDGPYVAPECVHAPARATSASDVFSAGLVFFELLVGGRAFEKPDEMMRARAVLPHPPSRLRPALPPQLDVWIQDMCAFEARRRPTAGEALRRFDEIVAAAAWPTLPVAPAAGAPHVTAPEVLAQTPSTPPPPSWEPELEEEMSPITSFTTAAARPLPVILLLDRSGSMTQEAKIDVLNDAVQRMIVHLADDDVGLTEVHLAAIAFGDEEATLHTPFTPARQVRWGALRASGRTPMGAALDAAVAMIEDREQVSSRSYRPTLVLVSDGMPTDDWAGAVERFTASERASKAHRFALAIGADADRELLGEFTGPEGRLMEAHEADEIRKFFRFVTMSVSARTRSAMPNTVPDLDETDLAAWEF